MPLKAHRIQLWRRLALTLMVGITMSPIAQTTQKPSFEVVSVKPTKSHSESSGFTTTDHSLSARNVTVKSLIQYAYRVQSFQVIGGPDWLSTDQFDVEAKVEPDAVEDRKPRDPSQPSRIALMTQSMLEDRFELKIHPETRQSGVYAITVGKDGARLMTAVEGQGPAGSSGSVSTSGSRNKTELRASGIPLARLALALGNQLDRLVIDRTNLTGVYDIVLNWSSQTTTPLEDAVADANPSIFTAIQEQLGLKLESARGPIQVIVIDSVQKPSEN